MAAVVFYFHVHQPFRIKPLDFFSIGTADDYFNSKENRLDNRKILEKVAEKCYLPTNAVLLDLLSRHPDFKISFSITGVLLDQLAFFAPHVLDSFKALVKTGRVELVAETYYHSLAFLKSKTEFRRQVFLQQEKLHHIFGVTPTAFRNTELIYNNDVAAEVANMGYTTILAEGVDRHLGWRSPNFIYEPPNHVPLRVMLKNYRLSDDIAFRFSNKGWSEWPLTAPKFAHWLSSVNGNGYVINLFMDYETFGEHQWADTGIFEFMKVLPDYFKHHPDNTFMTVSEAAHAFPVSGVIDMPELTSWADLERDLSAWLSNPMQHTALDSLFEMEASVIKSQDPQLIENWRRLTTSDHFYYMCTKWFSDGDVHKYFSPNNTPYEAFTHFMNVLHDLRQKVYAKSASPVITHHKPKAMIRSAAHD